MIHWLQTAFNTYALHVEHGNGYQWWSGFGSVFTPKDLVEIGAIVALFRRWNCDSPRCPRHGKHPTADGLHHLCRKHHPDLPSRRLTLAEIHDRHARAKEGA